MPKFKVSWSGGPGMGEDEEVKEFPNLNAAENYAYEKAKEEYESYLGSHGIRDVEEIIDDGDADDEDEAWGVIQDEMESSIDFSAEPYNPEKEEIRKRSGE